MTASWHPRSPVVPLRRRLPMSTPWRRSAGSASREPRPILSSTNRCSTTVSPRIPARLTDVLTSCLSANPTARPSAHSAAIEVFDAVQAEPVVLTSVADPATEITRRIRATATAVSVLAPPSTGNRWRRSLVIGAVALLVAMAIGAGAIWSPGSCAGARSSRRSLVLGPDQTLTGDDIDVLGSGGHRPPCPRPRHPRGGPMS